MEAQDVLPFWGKAFFPTLASAALELWEWPGGSQGSTDKVHVVSKGSRDIATDIPEGRGGAGGQRH